MVTYKTKSDAHLNVFKKHLKNYIYFRYLLIYKKDANKFFTDFEKRVGFFVFPGKEAMKIPNYIKNILKINATPERVQEILSQIKSDTDSEQLLDFNKIIPNNNVVKFR